MAFENFYSHLVAWLKIILPLAALAILSTVVFFARENDGQREIPFLTDGGPDTPGERLAAPEFLGLTSDGSEVILRAKEVVPTPNDPNTLVADEITGRIETPSGRIIQAAAPKGQIDVAGNTAFFEGVVSVDTSDGFHVLTKDLMTRLNETYAQTDGAVRGEAPFGTLEAGGLLLSSENSEGNLLVFNDGVKLVYEPRK
jgi:lipopolysaccharide export system protein LptC